MSGCFAKSFRIEGRTVSEVMSRTVSEVMSLMNQLSDDECDTPTAFETASESESSDDDQPLVAPHHSVPSSNEDQLSDWEAIGHLVRNEVRETWQADAVEYEDALRLDAEEFEQEHANAIEFEETVRVDSYAPSTIREFRRIWSKFQEFMEYNPVLHQFLDANHNPLLPLDKVPCILFIRAIMEVKRQAAVDGGIRYLGAGSINNAVAALRYFGFRHEPVPFELSLFFRNAAKSQSRHVARERLFNRHPVPSQGLTWAALKLILSYARVHDPDLHCFLLNLIQSVSRGERVSQVTSPSTSPYHTSSIILTITITLTLSRLYFHFTVIITQHSVSLYNVFANRKDGHVLTGLTIT